jgi:catechol 2,3-dioxygenase
MSPAKVRALRSVDIGLADPDAGAAFFEIEWGPGRHGPGNNVFCYFLGPEDLPIEYTSEMQQIDSTYRAGMPEDWIWPPGRLDHWGISARPSERMEAAGLKVAFTDDGWRLDGWR